MLIKLKQTGKLNMSVLLVVMSVFCFTLSICRLLITGTYTYLFLNWNLFLAFIPWIISTYVITFNSSKNSAKVLLVVTWLLFFPNAPYILTDLFHLREVFTAPIWFDLILILSFAWTGLLFGFISLMDIETLLAKYFSPFSITSISVFFLFLSGFGIYLGRFLRWNSWDIISNPFGLLSDVTERFINPFVHPRTWGFTLLIGALLNMMYLTLKFIRKSDQSC